MIRTAFSHPGVEGFLFWGFWDARHWRPGAGIFDNDFKTKAAADSVFHLTHEVWSTSDTIKVDSLGQAPFRGFYGSYDIRTKSSAGKKKTLHVQFLKGGPGKIDAVVN